MDEKTIARFWSKVDVRGPEECWEWRAGKSHGYGVFRFTSDKIIPAHRVALMTTGVPLDGLLACHKCDNPPCCNPSHLFAGTPGDNNRDRSIKNRSSGGRLLGEDNRHSRLSDSQVLAAYQAYFSEEKRYGLLVDISRRFSITTSALHSILSGRTWSHVTGATPRHGRTAR